MKFTLSWLMDHLDTGATIDEICEGLIANRPLSLAGEEGTRCAAAGR